MKLSLLSLAVVFMYLHRVYFYIKKSWNSHYDWFWVEFRELFRQHSSESH